MNLRGFVLIGFVLMICTGTRAQTPANETRTSAGSALYQFSSADKRTVIPFELAANGILFQLQIAGSTERLWFSLDTGSGASYLDSVVASRLGLRASGNGTVHGAGAGSVPVDFIDSVTFELPGLTSSQHRVNTTDLSGLQWNHRIDGFLGYDFISRYVITIDYESGKMTVAEAAGYSYAGAGEIFPIKFRGKWPYIEGIIAVPGVKPETGEFLVDSGSGDAVDDPTIARTTGPVRKVKTGVGLGQAGEGVLGRALYLQLGSFRLNGPIAACCSDNPDDQRKIGTEVLRRFTVILDYARKRMILEPNSNFKQSFPDA